MSPLAPVFVVAQLATLVGPVRPALRPQPQSVVAQARDQSAAQHAEVVADIRIHGNTLTSDDEIRTIAGVAIGSPFGPETIDEVATRLRGAKRFQQVEVLKRFASIADPTQIVLVIIVDEGPVKIERTKDPDQPTRVVRQRRLRFMFLPVLDVDDGYGVTYGVRLGLPNVVGPRSRLSFPLTWGGEKRAGVVVDKELASPVFTRIQAGVQVSRRENPHFEEDDDRGRVWIRGERSLKRTVRIGATAGLQRVSFLGADDRIAQIGADVVLDTRRDPLLARNAIFARAGVEHTSGSSAGGFSRVELEGRGYVGLLGQTVLVLRVLKHDADAPLPSYMKPLLGGLSNLRGFRAGVAVGDTLVSTSAELRVPLTSPLSIGKIGVSAFVDTAVAYDKPSRFSDQTVKKGVGGSVWFSAAFLRIDLSVAHGIGGSTRVHVGTNLLF